MNVPTHPTQTRLLFVGDVMMGRLVNELLEQMPPAYPWGDTLPLFRNADWRCCNLECALSNRGAPWSRTPKTFHFRSDARNVEVLRAAGINAVCLANNHALDFEQPALVDTLNLLDEAGIARAGAGRDLAEAAKPAVMMAGALKLGLIAFTDNQPEWAASEQSPGVFFVPTRRDDPRAGRLLDLVRATRRAVDFLIVSAHWGGNWGFDPPVEHREFGHALVEAGADLVFGHSAHVARGIEIHRGKPVLYSAGDFIDDYAVDEVERNDRSFVFVLEVGGGALRHLELYPATIRMCQASLARGTEAEETVRQMRRLCLNLGTETRFSSGGQCLEIDLAETAWPRSGGGLKRPPSDP